MADSSKFHPALTITNIKSLVPITLDNNQGMYHSWATLFTNLARVHDLYDHLVPPTEEAALAAYTKAKSADMTLWRRLDAVIFQWIYGTISNELLLAILRRNDTAEGAWNRLESLFQDNKAAGATLLDDEFTTAKYEDFTSMDDFCNHLQSLVDRLHDVEAPVSNSRLVLRLIGALPEAYRGTVDFIQNQDPLPPFESCRSRLTMAERMIKARHLRENGESGSHPPAMVAADLDASSKSPAKTQSKIYNNNKNNYNNNNYNKGKGNYKSKGKGKSYNSHGGYINSPSQQHAQWQQPRQQGPPQWPQWNACGGWNIPPCPFRSSSWQPRPTYSAPRPSNGPGVLGPRPHSFNAMTSSCSAPSYSSYSPTDIEAAMNALSFSQTDGNYYMDTGATSHMSADAGSRLMRCNSIGDLYPLFSNSQAISSTNQSAFTVLPSDIWHNRLGHPDDNILKSLCSKKFIDCNKACKTFCSSCPLGKHSKLPFL